MTKAAPNPDQLQALRDYAHWAGPEWKLTLSRDWMRAGSEWPGDRYSLLHQLRNSHGPAWLNSYKLPLDA